MTGTDVVSLIEGDYERGLGVLVNSLVESAGHGPRSGLVGDEPRHRRPEAVAQAHVLSALRGDPPRLADWDWVRHGVGPIPIAVVPSSGDHSPRCTSPGSSRPCGLSYS